MFIPILPIYYFWAKSFYDKALGFLTFMSSPPMVLFYAFVSLTLIRALWRLTSYLKRENDSGERNSSNRIGRLFQLALSQTLLISTKSYEDQTVTEHIREVDPNDFEFQATLRRILAVIQDDKSKIVVVLDNIDRLPKDEIDDYWALVRSVFSRGGATGMPRAVETIRAIVPYDRHLVGASNLPVSDDKIGTGLRSIKSREIFSKTFDEILIVSPPVMSNSREFFQEKIQKALPNFRDEESLVRVYLIFNQIVINENGKVTPRQVLSFINELSGIYVLHEGCINLPTIAVFIAYQDELELNPTKLTEKGFISDRLRTIASDVELERNLAALIFNVEPNLAFQILLDDQIRSASIGPTSGPLSKLASSPGFDLRVGDVIATGVREWQGAGDFGKVISNYSALAGNAALVVTGQYFDALVMAFFKMNLISSTESEYRPYLKIFEITRQAQMAEVAEHFIWCVFNQLRGKPDHEIKDGQNLAKAILAVQEAISRDGSFSPDVKFLPEFPTELQVTPIVFGVGQMTYQTAVTFKSLGIQTLGLAEDSPYLADLAAKAPHESLGALSEFRDAGLLELSQWIQVGNALLEKLIEENGEGQQVSALLLILKEVWVTTENRRSELNVKAAVDNTNLHNNLHAAFSDGISEIAFDVALVIFGQEMIANGYDARNSDEYGNGYKWFSQIIFGHTSVAEGTYSDVADLVIRSNLSGLWTEMGETRQPNDFLSGVVRQLYVGTKVPILTFNVFIACYDYLRAVLGGDISKAIENLSAGAASEKFKFVNFENLPLSLISDSYLYGGVAWRGLHTQMDDLLNCVTDAKWSEELDSPGVISQVLGEKLHSSGFQIGTTIFRATLENFVIDVLNGKKQPGSFNYDLFFDAVDKNFYPDMYRKIRDALTTVSGESLSIAQARFPKFLNAVVSGGDRISKGEKDSIIRNLLAPALEGRNTQVLDYFVTVGSSKVRDYIKGANDSTQKRIEGAETAFHRSHGDYDYAQSIADLLHGKRKARTLLGSLLGLGTREDL